MSEPLASHSVVADGLVEITEAQSFLGGVSRSFVYAEFNAGRLPFVLVGRRRMIPRRALLTYAAERVRGGQANAPA